MRESPNDSNYFSLEESRTAKTMLWSFVAPLILAVNCVLMREYLRAEAKAQCPPPSINTGGFSFDTYGNSSSLFGIWEVQCASGEMQFFYAILGVAIYICIGLSIMLPVIFYLRRRPVRQTKIFDVV